MADDAKWRAIVKEIEFQNRQLRKQIKFILLDVERFKQSSCYRKKAFYSPKEAASAGKKNGQRHYPCYVCSCYHLTTVPKEDANNQNKLTGANNER